jgi:putative ABC transport system permease protein
MRLGRALRISWRALTAHRLRTALALASVSAGVTALVLIGAIAEGTARGIDRQIQSLGANLLIVRPAEMKRFVGRKEISGLATTLTPDDYAVVAALPGVAQAAPGIDANANVKGGNVATPALVVGTTPAFAAVRRFTLRSGRFFDADDDRHARRVAVLGARVAEALFEGEGTGRQLRIRGVPFDVVGVLAAKGVLADGDEDNRVLVPVRTGLRRVFNVTWLTAIYISVADPADLSSVEARIDAALGERHRTMDDGRPDFEVQDAARYFALQRRMSQSLQALSLWVGGVALLLGGTGIMALMLLSVKERTGEIGLRVAVGARPRDIVNQFLMESTALSLGGWIVGMLAAALGALGLGRGTTLALALPSTAIGGSLLMAIVVGVGFGAWPARRASVIPPIRALAQR